MQIARCDQCGKIQIIYDTLISQDETEITQLCHLCWEDCVGPTSQTS
jgi:hypothetical protein